VSRSASQCVSVVLSMPAGTYYRHTNVGMPGVSCRLLLPWIYQHDWCNAVSHCLCAPVSTRCHLCRRVKHNTQLFLQKGPLCRTGGTKRRQMRAMCRRLLLPWRRRAAYKMPRIHDDKRIAGRCRLDYRLRVCESAHGTRKCRLTACMCVQCRVACKQVCCVFFCLVLHVVQWRCCVMLRDH